MERSIFEYVFSNLSSELSERLENQLEYLCHQRRIDYKKNVVIELYPKKYGEIPEQFLFDRTEEFRLAKVYYTINEVKHTSRIHMVSGQIFDLTIKPKPSKGTIKFLKIEIEGNLTKNIYVEKHGCT